MTKKYCSRACKHEGLRKTKTAAEIARQKLRLRISGLMWYSLKKQKRGISWERLVGYTLDDLVRHIEASFQPGMTWQNMGKWHIDHKRPVSSFSFTHPTDPDFLRCWDLSNLQPLWASDNLSKGARLDWKPLAA